MRAQYATPAAVFPGAVVTDQDLKVQTNGTQTSLIGAITISASTAPIASCTNIPGNSLATIDTEIIAAYSCSGNILTFDTGAPGCTSGRACDGSTAAAHNNGAPVSLFSTAWHHNALRVEVEAIETALGANLNAKLNTLTMTAVTGYVISPEFNADVVGFTGNTFQNSDGSYGVTYQGVVNGQQGYFTNTAIAAGPAGHFVCGQASPLLNCGEALYVQNQQLRSSSTTGYAIEGITTGNNSMLLIDNGGTCTVGFGVSGVSCTSDERLKTKIAPGKSELRSIMSLDVKQFAMKKDPDQIRTGLLAQQVRKVYPDAVTEDRDGNLQLSYTALVPRLLKTVQEEQAEIEALRRHRRWLW